MEEYYDIYESHILSFSLRIILVFHLYTDFVFIEQRHANDIMYNETTLSKTFHCSRPCTMHSHFALCHAWIHECSR